MDSSARVGYCCFTDECEGGLTRESLRTQRGSEHSIPAARRLAPGLFPVRVPVCVSLCVLCDSVVTKSPRAPTSTDQSLPPRRRRKHLRPKGLTPLKNPLDLNEVRPHLFARSRSRPMAGLKKSGK